MAKLASCEPDQAAALYFWRFDVVGALMQYQARRMAIAVCHEFNFSGNHEWKKFCL
jgi:hypothetical protein